MVQENKVIQLQAGLMTGIQEPNKYNRNFQTGKSRRRDFEKSGAGYLDLIEIHFQPDRGDARILKPDLANLRHQDGRYLITNQGDEVSLIFDGYDKKAKGRYSLVSYGWYERYADAPAPGKSGDAEVE